MCKASSPVRGLGLHGGLRRVHLRLLGRLSASLCDDFCPALAACPTSLDQAPLSLCNLLSEVLEPYCSASESFLPPGFCQSPGSHRILSLQNRLVWGTGSQSEPRSGCCPLHHSTVHSIIWTTSIVWTYCKYCSKKAFSPTG